MTSHFGLCCKLAVEDNNYMEGTRLFLFIDLMPGLCLKDLEDLAHHV